MPHAADITSICLPSILRDRIASMRMHDRQPYYEVIEEALDVFEEVMPREWPDADGSRPGRLIR